jgi:two-component system LytT family response regulator
MKTKIAAIIVEDEPGAMQSLKLLLHEYCPEIEVVASASTIAEAQKIIEEYTPHLAFLDIELSTGTSFELLEKLADISFKIIFTTAFDHYAIKAIKFAALDYLLKPIDADELISAVSKITNHQNDSQIKKQLLHLLGNLKPDNVGKRLAIPEQDGLSFLNINEIVRMESEGSYTNIYLENNKKITSSKSLGEYEEIVNENQFIRIHRSHIININFVKKYIKGDGGVVIMTDNTQVEVSRRKKIDFLQKLSG